MDPYYLIKMEVSTGVGHLKELLDTRQDMLSDPRGINVEVFRTLGIQLTNEIAKVNGLVRDIEDTIAQVKSNPASFGISDVELGSREQFVKDVAAEIAGIEERAKEQSMNQRVVFHPASAAQGGDDELRPAQEQVLLGREETIGLLEENVNRQLQVAREIDNELENEKEVILSLDESIDNAHDAMRAVTNQIKEIIENEGTAPTVLVVLLSIALVVLLFLAV